MAFDFFEVLEILIIYQCVAFIVNLIVNNGRKSSFNFWLSLLLAVILFNFVNVLLLSMNAIRNDLNYGLVFGFLYGPLLMIYTESLVFKNGPPKARRIIHFLPAIITLFLLIASDLYQLLIRELFVFTIAVVLHILIYIVKSLFQIDHIQRNLKTYFSSVQNKNLNWLRKILITFMIILLLIPLESIFYESLPTKFNFPFLGIIVFTLVTVNLIYFRGLKYPEIMNEFELKNTSTKYNYSKLSKVEMDRMVVKIKSHMESQKPYLNSELSLKELSNQIDINPRELSQVINEYFNSNFFEFINSYRIEMAKNLLKAYSQADMRINEVMYNAGFNSKSTFNSIFKKATGETPKEYREK